MYVIVGMMCCLDRCVRIRFLDWVFFASLCRTFLSSFFSICSVWLLFLGNVCVCFLILDAFWVHTYLFWVLDGFDIFFLIFLCVSFYLSPLLGKLFSEFLEGGSFLRCFLTGFLSWLKNIVPSINVSIIFGFFNNELFYLLRVFLFKRKFF